MKTEEEIKEEFSKLSKEELVDTLADVYRFIESSFDGIDGCTDGSCVVQKRSGMHTNGGCKCYERRTLANIVFQRIRYIRKAIFKTL